MTFTRFRLSPAWLRRAWQPLALAAAAVVGLTAAAGAQSPELSACTSAAEPDARIRACSKVIDSPGSPERAIAYNFRAVAWHDKQDMTRALADYDKAVAHDPGYANAANNRGIARQAVGDLDGAIADHTTAIALDPADNNGAYRFRSIALRLKGEFDAAIADAAAAIRLYPDYNAAYVARGMAFEEEGSLDRAREDFATALALPAKYLSGPQAQAEARVLLAALDAGTSAASRRAKPGGKFLRRVALVVGNADYRAARKLINTVHDASDISQVLRRLGFEVIEVKNAGRQQMTGAIDGFRQALDGADLALFFYAGHGLQVAGRNYLIPTDAEVRTAADLSKSVLDLDAVLTHMEAQERVNLVILDACRDNPFGRALDAVKVDDGLAPVRGRSGTLIAYATQPGNVARDGTARNSPFSGALIRHLPTPGLDIGLVMRRVRAQVIALTRDRQVPWEHSSLVGEVLLVR